MHEAHAQVQKKKQEAHGPIRQSSGESVALLLETRNRPTCDIAMGLNALTWNKLGQEFSGEMFKQFLNDHLVPFLQWTCPNISKYPHNQNYAQEHQYLLDL